MARREEARAEAAFLRGDVGVDGGSTRGEDEKDQAELERDRAREQFVRGRTWLGREFLTWLLWRSEPGDALLTHEGEGLTVLFAGRVVLRAAPAGTGIIAGGPMRAVFETAGIHDVVTKSVGTSNPHNMIKATFAALQSLNTPRSIAAKRGKKVNEVLGRTEKAAERAEQ